MMNDKEKIRLAVRVFLCANKGKRYTSKQLSEFLNEFGFGGRGGCTSTNVARLLTNTWVQERGITRRRKDKKTVWEYGVI